MLVVTLDPKFSKTIALLKTNHVAQMYNLSKAFDMQHWFAR